MKIINSYNLPKEFKSCILAIGNFDGCQKGHQKIFFEAIRSSEVDSTEVCHIGDDLHADIQGAYSVGIEAILIERNKKHKKNGLTTVSSFQELL